MTMQLAEKDFLRIFLSRMLLLTLGYNSLEWQIDEDDQYALSLSTARGGPFSASEFVSNSRSYRLITAVEDIFFHLNMISFTYSLPETDCCPHDFYEKTTEKLVENLINLL